jgi:DNA-binding NarL/FixJ family response regulator
MRVLLADDRCQVRSALRLALEQRGVGIVGEVADSTGLMDWVTSDCPDAVLLDWELPGLPAADLVAALRACCPCLRVIALSGLPEAREAAMRGGVDLFVSKGEFPERLLASVIPSTGLILLGEGESEPLRRAHLLGAAGIDV